jgi:hypothetical protein
MDPTLTAAAIGVGGTVIVGVAGFWASVSNTNKTAALTLRAVELTEQGQVTDRYTKAIEQLGSDKVDTRMGGMYALERIARDSPRDHPTIMEVLAAFIREHAHGEWPADVRAAVTVMGRRTIQYDNQQIKLNSADLSGANFAHMNLSGADLAYSDLSGADLTRAELRHANLERAVLRGANLEGVILDATSPRSAHLEGASLRLEDFKEYRPRLQGWQRDTGSGHLKRAATKPATRRQ